MVIGVQLAPQALLVIKAYKVPLASKDKLVLLVPRAIKVLQVHKVLLEKKVSQVFLVNKVIKGLEVLLVHKVNVAQLGSQVKRDFRVHKEFKVLRVG
jgi:hypothetical protein